MRAEFDRFKTPDREPSVIANCVWCHGEVYVGDEVYRIDDGGGFVHDRCADDFARERVYDRWGVVDENGNVE